MGSEGLCATLGLSLQPKIRQKPGLVIFGCSVSNKTVFIIPFTGVEWDDISRGKHDGSCVDAGGNTVRYFECAMGAGSFVKPNKLYFGKAFGAALHERYVKMDAPEESPGCIIPDAFVTTSSGVQKSIEFLGEHKIR